MALFDNLIGHWPFDESTGSVAADLSSQSNDGVYTNMNDANHVAGKVNNATLHGGINAKVLMGDVLDSFIANNPTLKLTTSQWVFLPPNGPATEQVMSKYTGSGADQYMLPAYASENNPTAAFRKKFLIRLIDSAGKALMIFTTTAATNDVWINVITELDFTLAAANRTKLFINGVNDTDVTSYTDTGFNGQIQPGAGTQLSFGDHENGGNPLLGKVDEPMMWNRLLTADEKSYLVSVSWAISITNVSPVSGANNEVVTITTTNALAAQGTGGVTFDGLPASIVSWSDTQIVCNAPSHANGLVDIVVTNNDGFSATESNAFTYDNKIVGEANIAGTNMGISINLG